MAKTLLVSLGVIATSLGFTSCEDESEYQEFTASMTGYLLEEGEGDNITFTPYYYFTSTNSLYPLDTVFVIPEDEGKQEIFAGLVRYSDYGFCTSGNMRFSKPSEVNGKYAFSMRSTKSEVFKTNFELSYSDDKTLGKLVVEDFKYDGTRISANVKEMPNVAAMGYVLNPYYKGYTPKRVNSLFYISYTNPNFTDGSLDLVRELSSNYTTGADYIEVKVFAATSAGIYRESETKTIEKGGNTFVEDKQ